MSLLPSHPDVKAAITKLRSLHDGDIGVIETVACGAAAIPALREILFSREPSGIYEIRRHAVEALASLGALDSLREFLALPREISDPVERTGEDAVMNAAALALGRSPDTRDLPLLLSLLRRRPLAGVIESLGRFRHPGTVPYLLDALGDDFLRNSAQDALRKMGSRVRRALITAAVHRHCEEGREPSSSLARRRSALRLLQDLPLRPEHLPSSFCALIDDSDGWIALLAIRIILPSAQPPIRAHGLRRLVDHLKSPDGLLAREIEDLLVAHYPDVAPAIADAERALGPELAPWRTTDHTRVTLERVRKRIETSSQGEVRYG